MAQTPFHKQRIRLNRAVALIVCGAKSMQVTNTGYTSPFTLENRKSSYFWVCHKQLTTPLYFFQRDIASITHPTEDAIFLDPQVDRRVKFLFNIFEWVILSLERWGMASGTYRDLSFVENQDTVIRYDCSQAIWHEVSFLLWCIHVKDNTRAIHRSVRSWNCVCIVLWILLSVSRSTDALCI